MVFLSGYLAKPSVVIACISSWLFCVDNRNIYNLKEADNTSTSSCLIWLETPTPASESFGEGGQEGLRVGAGCREGDLPCSLPPHLAPGLTQQTAVPRNARPFSIPLKHNSAQCGAH